MRSTDIEYKILQGAECKRCGLKSGSVGFPECYVGGKQAAVAHEMVVPIGHVMEMLKGWDVTKKSTTVDLAQRDAQAIGRQLQYVKTGDTLVAKAPDGTNLKINVLPNKKQ